MSWFHYALLALACAALLLSWNLPRCRLWVFSLAAAFIVSVAYYRLIPAPYGFLPNGAFVAFAADCLLFIIIREMHATKWEIFGLGSVAIASATINALQLIGTVSGWPPVLAPVVYSSILEIANAVYLLLICGMGILERLADASHDRHHMYNHRGGGLASIINYTHAEARKKTKVSRPLRHW